MLADQPLRGGMHRRGVERARHAPGAVLLECQVGAAIDDAIEIVALDRREARIEIRRAAFRGEHRDRLRPQMEIDRVAHIVGIPLLGEIDMRDLTERVHAGIGASGAEDGDALAGKSRDRRRSSTPCTETPLSCICQPINGVPSYSMVSL